MFSYFKKSSGCLSCHYFLTTNKPLEVNNNFGSQYTLIDLVDRGSLKYTSHNVVECLFILYESFLKIDNCDFLKKEFYSGHPQNLLVHLSMCIVAERFNNVWKDWRICDVWNWDILKKVCTTWVNIILSEGS